MTSEAAVSTPPAISSTPAKRDFYWLRSFVAGVFTSSRLLERDERLLKKDKKRIIIADMNFSKLLNVYHLCRYYSSPDRSAVISGGVAGCCAKTTIAPLDRVKILLQAQSPHYKHLGVLSTLKAVPKKEGFLGLYKGNGAMMVRIFPYGAIQFMAFDNYKKLLSKQIGISGHIHRLVAGSMAGMTAVICTYPLDVIRARLAFQVTGEHRYTGIANAFHTIYLKEGGVLGFYRGLTPTLIGMAPYAGFSFFTFGTLKSLGLKHFPEMLGRPSSDNPDVLILKTRVNLLCGGVAGAIAQTISYPLDVARRRMQLGSVLPDSEKCVSLSKTLTYVYKEYGIKKGLYRGLSLNYIRCIPSQAVAFTTYEFMKQFLHLN